VTDESKLFGLVSEPAAPTTDAGRRAEAEAAGYGYNPDTWQWVKEVGQGATAIRAEQGISGLTENAMRNRASAAGRSPDEQKAWEEKTGYKDAYGAALIKKELQEIAANRKHKEDAKRLLKESEPPNPEKYDVVPPRVKVPGLVESNVVRNSVTMVKDYGTSTDPLLATSKKTSQTEVVIPTDWVATVLSVKEETIPDATVQKEFTVEGVPPYTIRARRIQPTTEELTGEVSQLSVASNPDIILPNPCRISPSSDPKIRWGDINMHPLYSPANSQVSRPSPGDLVRVIIETGKEVKRGVLLGVVQRRPLPESLEDFRTPQSTQAALAKNYPLTADLETDSSGCASGNVAEEDIKTLNFITLKNPNTYIATLSELSDNARRFIKAFDEELSRSPQAKAIITSTIRTDVQQGSAMYKNWFNHRPLNNTSRIVPKAEKDKYVKRLYGKWSNVDELLELFHTVSKEGGWSASSPGTKKKVGEIINSNNPAHSSGNAIDVSFRGNTERIWIAVKKAAKRTCSSILIEKDHFHISAKPGNKFSWNKFTKKKFSWLDTPKGPPAKEKVV
jgi:biotin carboxyl carrier protein